MSDLRTRIAKATWESHRDRQLAQLGMKPSEYPADIPIPDWAYAIADAVISELGLRLEYGMGGQHDYSDNPEIVPVTKDEMKYRTWNGEDFTFRYVTNWKADDE